MEVFPGAHITPGTLIANTDTKHYLDLTDKVYRFTPAFLAEMIPIGSMASMKGYLSTILSKLLSFTTGSSRMLIFWWRRVLRELVKGLAIVIIRKKNVLVKKKAVWKTKLLMIMNW